MSFQPTKDWYVDYVIKVVNGNYPKHVVKQALEWAATVYSNSLKE